MDIEPIYFESRCKICSLDPQIRKIIDDLLSKNNNSFDTVYFYLDSVCRTYGIKTPSRSSLKRHSERHLYRAINLSEIIAPNEHIIDEDITYQALMESIKILDDREFKTLYNEWILSFKEPSICSVEKFYQLCKQIYDKAIPNRSSELLQHFVDYVEMHNKDLIFKWSD